MISSDYLEIEKLFNQGGIRSVLLVCGNSFRKQELYKRLCDTVKSSGIQLTEFSDFQPNPQYESVIKGADIFQREKCDFIIAAGGGSAMDVAKCIKLFYNMNKDESCLEQKITDNKVPILAIPTTAGTGSEATCFAVIYYKGNKQSVEHASCVPQYVFLDASLLDTLPEYQRKATMLDAFCHAVESYWSVNSTDRSKEYAAKAICEILKYQKQYLDNEKAGNEGMLKAANLAGCAINITRTTAAHAMCYKLTGLYGLAHGHAAAYCLAVLWPYMAEHTERCIDSRGEAYLNKMFEELAGVMGCVTVKGAVEKYQALLERLSLPVPKLRNEEELDILKKSVNPDRLKNNPVPLTEKILENLYRQILQ